MTYDKKHVIKRPTFDAASYRNRPKNNDLSWQIAKLELAVDELLTALKPFAEVEIEFETNRHFRVAKAIYEKHASRGQIPVSQPKGSDNGVWIEVRGNPKGGDK